MPQVIIRPNNVGTYTEMPFQIPQGTSGSEYLYVDGRENDINGWEHIPDENEPWLEAEGDGREIRTDVEGSQEGEFTFQDPTIHDVINFVYLHLRSYQEGSAETVDVELSPDNGLTWNLITTYAPPVGSHAWTPFDVSTILDTWAKIANARLKVTYHREGKADYVYIDASRLNVGWSDKPPPHWSLVDEEDPDEEATLVGTSVRDENYYLDTYNLENFPAVEKINWVRVYVRMRAMADWVNKPRGQTAIRTHNTDYLGNVITLPYPWETYYTEYPTNPNTGEAWTVEEINALEAGVRGRSEFHPPFEAYNQMYCTQVYVLIDYSPIPVKPIRYLDGFVCISVG